MKISLDNMVIAPQRQAYWIDGAPPRRIGDITYIRLPATDFRIGSPRVKVILLADASGRQWLVKCP